MVEKEVTKEDIQKRIDDWRKRISSLYDMIAEWVASDSRYRCMRHPGIQMYEELMQKLSVRPEVLELLDVYRDKDLVATIKPIGLWIIGANGRLDILTRNGATILVDKAEKFHKPRWVAYSSTNGKHARRFDKSYFVQLIEE
jgi:hypothetical protein